MQVFLVHTKKEKANKKHPGSWENTNAQVGSILYYGIFEISQYVLLFKAVAVGTWSWHLQQPNLSTVQN